MSQLKKLNQQVKQVKCITLSANQSHHSHQSSVKTLPKPIASRPVTSIAKNNNKVEAVKIDLVKQKKQITNISVTRSTSSARTRSASNGPKDEKIPRILGDLLGPEIELADCQDFLLQLNEPQFKMDEDLMKERVILANRIANTIKIKKRIPTTTADYYKLCSVIGKGAFAKVCLGIQILTGVKVAMKIIDKSSLKNESAKKRLMQEITLMKLLQPYKCCIRLYEVFETKRQIYLIMEYVEGGDLIKFTKEKPLSEQMAKNIFGQLILALQILQTHNILHRDIKLDNILLQGEQIKLCDFGVSRQIVKGQKILEQCGTPAYLAPEIMTSKTGYEGFASDIWSSGVLLYILLIGKTPFKGNNMNELNQQIQSGLLNFMEIKKANISNEAVDLMKSILNINPKLRFIVITYSYIHYTLTEIIKHSWMKDIDFKQIKYNYFVKVYIFSLKKELLKRYQISFTDYNKLTQIQIQELFARLNNMVTKGMLLQKLYKVRHQATYLLFIGLYINDKLYLHIQTLIINNYINYIIYLNFQGFFILIIQFNISLIIKKKIRIIKKLFKINLIK